MANDGKVGFYMRIKPALHRKLQRTKKKYKITMEEMAELALNCWLENNGKGRAFTS